MIEGTVTLEDIRERTQKLAETHISYDGMDGEVLELISRISGLPGDDFTDNQCLWMIHKIVNDWSALAD